MDVRLARPTDAPLVLALSLDDRAHLVRAVDSFLPASVGRTVAHSLVPLPVRGRTWIAREDEKAALLEAHPREYVIGWDITRLVARGDPEPVLGGVIWAAVQHLQNHGVPRLFARCREAAEEELKRLDFRALAREYILVGPTARSGSDAGLPEGSRYRRPEDAWPLHQLESDTTPALVRQIEGLTSLDWTHRSRDQTEIVVERDGRIVAWVGWRSKSGGQLGLLVHPEYCDVAPDLLNHVLQTVPSATRLTARVREYQNEPLEALVDAGFRIVSEETLMLKHALTEPARARARMQVARVPSIQITPIRLGAPGRKIVLVGVSPGAKKEDNV